MTINPWQREQSIMSPPGISFFPRYVPKAIKCITPFSMPSQFVSEGEHESNNKEDLSNLMPNPEYGFGTERMLRNLGSKRMPNPFGNGAKPKITSDETLNRNTVNQAWYGGEKNGERSKCQWNCLRTVASFPRAFEQLVPVFLTLDPFDIRKIYVWDRLSKRMYGVRFPSTPDAC